MKPKPPSYRRGVINVLVEWLVLGPLAIVLVIVTVPIWILPVLIFYAIAEIREEAQWDYARQRDRILYDRLYGPNADLRKEQIYGPKATLTEEQIYGSVWPR